MDFSLAKKIVDDSFLEVNGRRYDMNIMPNLKKEIMLATVMKYIGTSSFIGDVMTDKAYPEIKKNIFDYVFYDGMKLKEEHFEEFAEDYLIVIMNFLAAYLYPFLKGMAGK